MPTAVAQLREATGLKIILLVWEPVEDLVVMVAMVE
jgi:hypothetical protein